MRSHAQTVQAARAFFAALEKDAVGHRVLCEQNHRVEFDLTDDRPFHLEIRGGHVRVRVGRVLPRRFDRPDLTHLELERATLKRLLAGGIRFTDALIPTDPTGQVTLRVLECTLLKWSVLNWLGRLFRAGQTTGVAAARTPAEERHA